jgi:hypothetical protein
MEGGCWFEGCCCIDFAQVSKSDPVSLKLALLITLEYYPTAESLRSHSFGRHERGTSRSSRRIVRAKYLLINSFAVFPLESNL